MWKQSSLEFPNIVNHVARPGKTRQKPAITSMVSLCYEFKYRDFDHTCVFANINSYNLSKLITCCIYKSINNTELREWLIGLHFLLNSDSLKYIRFFSGGLFPRETWIKYSGFSCWKQTYFLAGNRTHKLIGHVDEIAIFDII